MQTKENIMRAGIWYTMLGVDRDGNRVHCYAQADHDTLLRPNSQMMGNLRRSIPGKILTFDGERHRSYDPDGLSISLLCSFEKAEALERDWKIQDAMDHFNRDYGGGTLWGRG